MTRFGDLMGGNVTQPTPPVPIEPEPDVVEEEGQVDLDSLSKVELEEYGRTIGIELDRRHNKKKLVKELEDQLKKQK